MLLLAAVLLLLALILWAKLDAFLALLVTALATGLAAGLAPAELLKTLQNGIGSTLGSLAPVLALGVMLGSFLAETGAAQAISSRLLAFFGEKNAGLTLACTGFTVGIAMFYNAGFVVLAPLAFSVSRAASQPLVPLAIAMAAPLSVTHGFLPPHPGATAVAVVFGADLGKTLLLGLLVAVPAVALGGLFFPKFLAKIPAAPPAGLFPERQFDPNQLPHFGQSLLLALAPVLLMAASTVVEFYLPDGHTVRVWAKFLGDPLIALLLAVLAALLFFSKNGAVSQSSLLANAGKALGAAASLLLVIAAGGAFKQVLVDSGMGKDLAAQMAGLPVSPLVLGWLVATMLRVSVGSATVAGMTAAGIVQPLVAAGGASPELMTLAVGAGSLMCSHVNDTGFWMFREWFGLSIRDTFRTWTAMETLVGSAGLAGVLLLDTFGMG